MLSKNDMKALVDEIIVLGNELRHYYESEDILAKAHPAPEKSVLDSFAARFIGKLPPSYLQLMSIYNGIENFDWLDVSILPIEFLMQHDTLEEYWVDVGAYGEGELFIFAQSNFDANVVAFLIKIIEDNGEMRVAHFDANGPLDEYKDFETYLRERRKWFEENLAEQKADREGLSDDD